MARNIPSFFTDFGFSVLGSQSMLRGPKFIRDPQDKIYESQNDNPRKFVEFRCEADGNPYPTYDWFRKRQTELIELDPVSDQKFTITNGRLVIHNPKDTEDNGEYYCKATNVIGSVLSTSATLRFGCKQCLF